MNVLDECAIYSTVIYVYYIQEQVPLIVQCVQQDI